jgi:Zn-dependent protease/predicted transcriptional regulator
MRASLTLGKIAGIEIGVNWSLAIMFFLIAAGLASEIFPSDVPGYSGTSYIIAALMAVVLFYASLLAHELGHALVARRLGTKVEGITLWLFGGVARLSGDSMSASTELQMTLIGPVITIGVGVLFAIVAAIFGTLNVFPLTTDMFAWLSRINFILAAFNLIPAFPLDGGRVLRAILWRVTHNQVRATAIAAWLGRAFGVLMIVGGLWYFWLLQGSLINGVYFAILGWFLFTAAGSQELQTRLQGSLAGVHVSDIMTPDPVTAPDWSTVDDFVARFASVYRATAYPVRSFNGQLTGLIRLQDLGRVAPQNRSVTQLRDIAVDVAKVPVVRPDEELAGLMSKLEEDSGYALVMDGDRLVGLITPADIQRALHLANLRRRGLRSDFSPSSQI